MSRSIRIVPNIAFKSSTRLRRMTSFNANATVSVLDLKPTAVRASSTSPSGKSNVVRIQITISHMPDSCQWLLIRSRSIRSSTSEPCAILRARVKLPRFLDDVTYAAMRAVLASLFFAHGLQKVFGLLGGHQFPLTSQLGIAGLVETVLGPFIGLGLVTSVAALIASGEMAFAYFIGHYPKGPIPAVNGGDLAVALCFAFLYISVRGGGAWSVDAMLGRKH